MGFVLPEKRDKALRKYHEKVNRDLIPVSHYLTGVMRSFGIKQKLGGETTMIKTEKCEACEGTGKDPAPPGIHKRCKYCRGTGWAPHHRLNGRIH